MLSLSIDGFYDFLRVVGESTRFCHHESYIYIYNRTVTIKIKDSQVKHINAEVFYGSVLGSMLSNQATPLTVKEALKGLLNILYL